MSFYNMLHGVESNAEIFLSILGIDIDSIPRFRDCYIEKGKICIYTRTGGGNRECYEAKNNELSKHPLFINDEDDEYDCTYAKFFYRFPEDYREQLEKYEKENPSLTPQQKFEAALDALKNIK